MQFANEIITHHVRRRRRSSFPCRQLRVTVLLFGITPRCDNTPCDFLNPPTRWLRSYPIPSLLPFRRASTQDYMHARTCNTSPELLQCYITLAAFVSSSEILTTSSSRGEAQSVNLALISCRFGEFEICRVAMSEAPRDVAHAERWRPLSTVIDILSVIGWITSRSYKVIFFLKRLPGDGRCIGSR